MLNKYKRIRDMFSPLVVGYKENIDAAFAILASDPEALITINGIKVIPIDTTDDEYRHSLLKRSVVGLGVLYKDQVPKAFEEGFLKSMGIKLGEKFIFIHRPLLVVKNARSTVKFFMAHELAHDVLGHIASGRVAESSQICAGVEYEADFLATLIYPEYKFMNLQRFLRFIAKQVMNSDEVTSTDKRHTAIGLAQISNRIYNHSTGYSYR